MPDHIRDAYVAKLNAARQKLNTAGPIHRRDLIKHIRRMERELYDYDRYHAGGDPNSQRAKPDPPGAQANR